LGRFAGPTCLRILHINDLHATILYRMGLSNMQLTYFHKGRPERPTINEGAPYRQIAG